MKTSRHVFDKYASLCGRGETLGAVGGETLGAVGRTVHRLPSLSAFSLRRVLTDQ